MIWLNWILRWDEGAFGWNLNAGMVTVSKFMILSPFRSLNVGYMDQSNTTPRLQRTVCPPHPHLSFVAVSLLCPNAWLETPRWDSKGHSGLHETYAFGRRNLYVHFPQFFPLHFVNLSSGTSGSYPSTLNGISSPGRRDPVGPWSALSVASVECTGNIRIQIFYFANRYFLLLALIGM